MSLHIVIKGANKVIDGIWEAKVSPSDLHVFRSDTNEIGEKSLILSRSPVTSVEDAIELVPHAVSLVIKGTTDEATIIERVVVAQKRFSPESATHSATVTENPISRIFWVTVGKELQKNYAIGVANSTWGVPQNYESRLDQVQKGDYILFYGRDIGFSLCQVTSVPFTDTEPIWPDGLYPRRVTISSVLRRNTSLAFSNIYGCLRDRSGIPYRRGNSAGRAIGGGGGIFRQLDDVEVSCLFERLNWSTVADK